MATKRESKRVMTVVFTVEAGEVRMKRTTRNFPIEDFRACVEMLGDDLDAEREKLQGSRSAEPTA